MRLLIVDGTNAVMRRAQANKEDGLDEIAGDVVQRILRASLELDATHLAVAFDSYERNIRQDILESYKADRTNDTRPFAVALAKRLMARRICVASYPRYEADDVIASMVQHYECAPVATAPVIMTLSSDHDLLALASPLTTPYTYAPSGHRAWLQAWDAVAVKERFGVLPHELEDYFTIKGGKGLDGLDGVGEKRAAALISAWGSVEGLKGQIEYADWWRLKLYRAVRMLRTNVPVAQFELTRLDPSVV